MIQETRQGKDKIFFSPNNQNTLYLRHWFCTDIEIVAVFDIDLQSALSLVGAKVPELAVSSLVSMSNDGGVQDMTV